MEFEDDGRDASTVSMKFLDATEENENWSKWEYEVSLDWMSNGRDGAFPFPSGSSPTSP